MSSLAFDPVAFFTGRTLGAGVVTDFTGRVVRRCTIETRGEISAEFGSLHFDERYLFDDGTPDDVMNWALAWRGSEFEAREPSVDGALTSAVEGPTWRLKFKRLQSPPLVYHVAFHLTEADLVLKQVELKRLGFTLARMAAYHRTV